jgi:type IV pilus assembly protein PilN
MIRINLLAEREQAKKKATPFQAAQKLTIGCSLIVIATLMTIGWWYLALGRESTMVDADIAAAQQETTRLRTILQQVQQFEQQRAQLEQRVQLIEQLRKSQTGPVHLLDQISRALPPMLWLTELKQSDKTPNEVVIDGRSTTLTGVSDFVKNLEDSGYFKRSIDIVSSTTESIPQPPGELIKFQLRAQFEQREPAKSAAPAASKPGGTVKSGG